MSAEESELLKKIQKQFNSCERIGEMAASYGLSEADVTKDPFEPLRHDLFLRVIREKAPAGAAVLDVGCGLGNLVHDLISAGYNAKGIDCAEGIISEGRKHLAKLGSREESIAVADFFSLADARKYDLIIANGVIWYYDEPEPFLRKAHALLKPGGVALIIHRNALFNLFALNIGTIEFITEELLDYLNSEERQRLAEVLTGKIPGLAEKRITHTSSKLKKRYDNPYEIASAYQACGLTVNDTYYTYIHAAPPRTAPPHTSRNLPELQLRYEKDWRGALMGSQFLVAAGKNG